MLDHIHKYCLLVAQTRHFLDLDRGDPGSFNTKFARRLGITDRTTCIHKAVPKSSPNLRPTLMRSTPLATR